MGMIVSSLSCASSIEVSANLSFDADSLSLFSISAAHLSLPKDSKHRIYSMQGNFLGPTATDRPVKIKITSIRETRTLVTRLVIVSQEQDSGKGERSCLSAMVDFYVDSGNTMMKFSAQPTCKVTHHSKLLSTSGLINQQLKEGIMTKEHATKWKATFLPFEEHFEAKPVPEGVSYHNLFGINFNAKTPQDSKQVQNKNSIDWFRPWSKNELKQTSTSQDRISLKTDPNNSTAIDASLFSFILDAFIAFLPLTCDHQFLDHAKNCSSLDFSLRFHIDDLDVKKWHLREMTTLAGDNERTYSQANCWREEGDEKLTLVATMTQASILRGEKPAGTKL